MKPRTVWSPWTTVGSIAVGAIVGLAVRDLPLDLAGVIVRGDEVDCGELTSAECAMRAAPRAVLDTLRYAVVSIVLHAGFTLAGIATIALGFSRRSRQNHDAVDTVRRSNIAQGAVIVVGVAAMVPTVWRIIVQLAS